MCDGLPFTVREMDDAGADDRCEKRLTLRWEVAWRDLLGKYFERRGYVTYVLCTQVK